MSKENRLNYHDLIDIVKEMDYPFSRRVYMGSIKEDLGQGISIWYDMGNGIAVFARSFILEKDTILVEQSNVASTVFIFNLGGKLDFTYKDKKEHTLNTNNFLVALASNDFCAEVLLHKHTRYTTVSVGIKEELFSKLAPCLKNKNTYMEDVQKNSYALFQEGKIDPEQFEMLSCFKNENTYEDLLKNIFLESKTTDLIHYTMGKITDTLNKMANLNFDIQTIGSLEKAKQIILNEYHTSLSIKEIAYRSATNECYLKKDFKAYYGMTIYEMLQKHRMESAKQLLQKDFPIKEVSVKVGYKHSGNFSKTFLKYFAITPREYKKKFN